jgi:REP element-mobilizing transposase RayT
MGSGPHFHSGDLRKGRDSQPGALYYITKNLLAPCVFVERQRDECCASLQAFRQKGNLLLHAFVIMRDHWHALFSLAGRLSLEKTLHELCRHMSFPSRRRGDHLTWQEGFYDHRVRQDDSVVDIVKYIEDNPVVEGLVEASAQWQWSSAHSDFAGLLDRKYLGRERWA